MALAIHKISAINELDRINCKYTISGGDEVKVLCPVHEDTSPSCCLNTKKNLWVCQVCDERGDIISLLALMLNTERETIAADLAHRYDIEEIKEVNPITVENWHKFIWNAGPLLNELRDRGVTDDLIRKARLGINESRIMIPIYDEKKRIINVRKYLPGAPGNEKMRNTRGYKATALYQIEQTEHDKIWICGGEIKALVAGSLLNPHKIGAVAVTAGEGTWDPQFNSKFAAKDVYVCMDLDAKGRKAAKMIAQALFYTVKSIKIVTVPLNHEVYPKGDINDFIGAEGGTDTDLLKMMEDAEEFELSLTSKVPDEITDVSLHNSVDPRYVRKRIRFRAIAAAIDPTPFLIPKTIKVQCDKHQKNCGSCPIFGMDQDSGEVTAEISPVSAGLLDMINAPKKILSAAITESLGIPSCRSAEFVVSESYKVSDTRLAPEISIKSEGSDNEVYPAMALDVDDMELNTPFVFTAVLYPHPKNQQAVLLIDSAEEAEDNLTTFCPAKDELAALEIFRPDEWTEESIATKLEDIYNDFAYNVTRIFARPELHFAHDLAFHSALLFHMNEKQYTGWTNILIIGDSSQGKTEVSRSLLAFYGLGEKWDCKNASIAGLLGGLQQMGSQWFVTWGIIPTHDRRLVILEECKGMSTQIIGSLTDMRSSGIAEIPKIERRKAHARTRLIMNSNPRSPRAMGGFSYGIEAIPELIGSPEDVRRFDTAIVITTEQISEDEINMLFSEREKIEHKYTSELSRRLILFSWTRKEEQVQFDDDALSAINEKSKVLCGMFHESIPLVDKGSMRFKLARLSIALANRTFSTSDDYTATRVRKCHIEYMSRFLIDLYSDPFFGYKDYSNAIKAISQVRDEDKIAQTIKNVRHADDFLAQLIFTNEICQEDIQTWCDVERDEAQRILSIFIRKHCLFRNGRYYRKTEGFISFLKNLDLSKLKGRTILKGEEM